uniref:Lipase maturation factor n=1 Tax=Felis catus TaxID=9685 RepID=A0ABI7W8W6_FELCA
MAAPEETLRRRKAGNSGPEPDTPPESGRDPTGCPARLRTGTFWLTRIVLLRALAFIYFVAFLVALHQNKQLIGDRGLLPCRAYLESVRRYFQGRGGWEAVSYAPTVLWLLDWSRMNANLDALALLGLGVSSFVLVTGCANMVLMATLWVLYMSLVNVGQIWYSFGWESQLLETGFLGIFLCPLWTLSRLPTGTPPSQIVLWGFRWLIFRIMLGADAWECTPQNPPPAPGAGDQPWSIGRKMGTNRAKSPEWKTPGTTGARVPTLSRPGDLADGASGSSCGGFRNRASSRSGGTSAGGTSLAWTSTMRRSRCPTPWPTSCTSPPGGPTALRRSATTSWSSWCLSSSSLDGGCASSTGPYRSCSRWSSSSAGT